MRVDFLVAVLVLAWVACPILVLAQATNHDRARSAMQSGEIRSLADIKALVGRQYPGRLLDADVAQQGGNGPWLYRLRVLQDDGRVVALTVDAKTGQVLGVKGAGNGKANSGQQEGKGRRRGN